MSSYEKWNDVIAHALFNEDRRGQPVRLHVTEEFLGSLLLDGAEGFLKAVRAGPRHSTRRGHCQRALQLWETWQARDSTPPPYLAYLALFVLAATHEGDYATHNYYGRLRDLLAEPDGGALASFDRMRDIWRDLAAWANEDRNGEVGTFEVRTTGKWAHVGIPKAEAVLSGPEREKLVEMFMAAGIDPSDPPTDDALLGVLLEHGTSNLRDSTIRVLSAADTDGIWLRDAILDVVRSELSAWDGTAKTGGTDATSVSVGILRLAPVLDRVAGVCEPGFRISLPAGLPEDGLALFTPDGNTVSCQEAFGALSTRLRREGTHTLWCGTSDQWRDGLELRAADGGWKLRLPGRTIRVLVPGDDHAVHGLLEVSHLPTNTPFFLLAHSSKADGIAKWINAGCAAAEPIKIRAGLPHDWSLYHVERIADDSWLSRQQPHLTCQSRTRLKLEGGIKSGSGAVYFDFAPPGVAIEGPDDGVEIYVNGEIRDADAFLTPDTWQGIHGQITVEARKENETVASQRFVLSPGRVRPNYQPELAFDRFHQPVRTTDEESPTTGVHGSHFLPGPHRRDRGGWAWSPESHSATLILGRRPGEIAPWPERNSLSWQPVWAITSGRRPQVVFVALEPNPPAQHALPGTPARLVRQWRKLIWFRRKRVRLPNHPLLQRLWGAYLEVARDAR